MGKTLKNSQRTIAAVSVASMALLNVGIMAPAGAAEDLTEVAVPAKTPNFKAMPNDVTLKIHKFTPNNRGDKANAANGTAVDEGDLKGAGSEPIKGVTFTIYKVAGIDLTTNLGWRKAQEVAKVWEKLTPSQKENATKITVPEKEGDTTYNETFAGDYAISNDAGGTDTTDDNGLATISNIRGDKRGFYVVKETITGDTVKVGTKDNVKANSVNKAAPFVVALPMTNQGERTEWLNEVNVYPKNTVTDVTKEVKDDAAPGVGNTDGSSNIEYTIKTGIPKNTDPIKAYELVDPLDSRLEYKGSAISIVDDSGKEIIAAGSLTGKASDAADKGGADYLIYNEDASGVANPADGDDTLGSWITIQFTEQGRGKLVEAAKANQDKSLKVKWVLTARLKDDITGGASIDNKAYLIPDNEGSGKWHGGDRPTTPPGNPSTAVVSKYGKLVIDKYGDKESTKLQGATFEIRTCTKQFGEDGEPKEENGKPTFTLGGKVSVKGESSWETNKKGALTVDGLQLNDFKNSVEAATQEQAEAAGKAAGAQWADISYYCLIETKAPDGYEKLPEMIPFQITTKDSTGSAKWTKTLKIQNVSNNGGFNLPLTGGKGIFGLVALGALLVLGSIGYIFLASRRRQES